MTSALPQPESSEGSSAVSDASPAEPAPFYVEGLENARAVVELHTCAKSTSMDALSEALRESLSESLRNSSIAVVPQSKRLSDIEMPLLRPGITPLIVMASLVSLQQMQEANNVSWEATVTTSLADHPGGSLRVVLTKKAAVSRASHTYRAEIHEKQMQQKAISAAAKALGEGIIISLPVL
jgi:hypothetical protein